MRTSFGRKPIRSHGAFLLFVALVLAGCSTMSNKPAATSKPSTIPSTTTTTQAPGATTTVVSVPTTAASAPCNEATIIAGAGHVSALNGFGCSGSWAYADVTVGPDPQHLIDEVLVLNASAGAWHVADRATACNNHLVPSNIYTQACTTS